MSNIPSFPRLLAGLCLAAVAAAVSASPGAARDRSAVIQVASNPDSGWLLQLSPGSGAVSGAKRSDAARKIAAAKTYPGYAAVAPGVQPGYAAAPAQRRTTGGLFGTLSGSPRAAVTPADRPAARTASQPQRAAGLFRRPAKPAPAAARRELDPVFLPQEVDYATGERPGTVVIDTGAKFLYLVGEGGMARRYGVGVGKPGFEWAGRHKVTRKSEWPTWTPPGQMRERERAKGKILPVRMDGGPENPLGARAMYLGSTLYRIHGTNQPWSIGKAVSSGCIRMRNEDVMDLYERVPVGTSVVVL